MRRLKEGGVEFVIINFQGTEELQLPTFNIPSEILNVVGQKKVRRGIGRGIQFMELISVIRFYLQQLERQFRTSIND